MAALLSLPILPGLIAALGFGLSNVCGKLTFLDDAGVLTVVSVRSVIGLALLGAALQVGRKPAPLAPPARRIALGLGVLFAANVYGVFGAIQAIPVPVAVLAYFVYPLLTGLVGAATGLDRVSWRGGTAAFVAFLGLALMIGAEPQALAPAGLALAFGAAIMRTAMLLITRARLVGADPRMTTWYAMVGSTVILVAVSLATMTWQPPAGASGWLALLGASVTTTVGILALFASAARIGPFRTALMMNLEPVISTALSVAFLGEDLGAWQLAGAAVMIGALCAFQLKR